MDIVFSMLIGMAWAIISLVLVEIIYLHTDSFSGWTKSEMVLLLLTFQITTEFFSAVVNSLENFPDHVRKGSFDFYLVRPVDPQFLIAFTKPDVKNMFYIFTNALPYLYLLMKNPLDIQLINILIYLYFVLLASILWITMKTIAVTLNFWWQKLDNLPHLLYNIVSLGKYPTTIFPKKIQMLFYTFLPIAFIAVIPTQALQGKTTPIHLLLATCITIFMVIFARLFWNFAIKNYSSASS
jgi:ABC-2 type transport system permease protein